MVKYRDLRFHSVQILTEFDRSNRRLSHIFRDYFKSESVRPTDKPDITNLVQETIRWRGYLDFLLSNLYHGRYQKIEYRLKNILRLGCYELLFRSHVPSYAVVDSAVELTKTLVKNQASGVTNAILRKINKSLYPRIDLLQENDSIERISAITSHPQWMIARWIEYFGFEKTIQLCKWNNTPPIFMIRRNQLKVKRLEFEDFLSDLDIDWKRCRDDPNFYQVNQIRLLQDSDGFEKGYFSFQDISAGLVTHLVDVSQDDIILDVCAAPGGKSTYLAERLGNNITIHAYDLDKERLATLRDNVKRLSIQNIRIEQKDSTVDDFPLARSILIDVPCTGTGVMSKRADLRWRRNESDLVEMQKLQYQILFHMSSYVQNGGNLVYSTCSLEPEENWDIVNQFLLNKREFKIQSVHEKELRKFSDNSGAIVTFPPRDNMDGIFAVKLEKHR